MGQHRHTLSTAFRPSVYSTGIQPRQPYSIAAPAEWNNWQLGGYNYGHFDNYGNWLWDNTAGALIDAEMDMAKSVAKKVAIVAGVGIVALGLYEYGAYKLVTGTLRKIAGKK